MLTFLTPWWGAAMLAAIGLPLLAHLLSRAGGRVAVFPAVRFVEQAAADVARVARPRHWLLALLRMSMLAMVVLAFMQPVWYRDAAAARRDEGLLVAVVVDRSASMQRVDGGVTLFDEAKRQALQLLGTLDPSRDRAVVVMVDRHPTTLLPEPSANFSELMHRLGQAQPTHERGDMEQALRLAAGFAERVDGSSEAGREFRVELFTDVQATTWPGELLADVSQMGEVNVHAVGDADGNVAMGRPTISPRHPVAGQRAVVGVEVANYGSEPVRVAVELAAGERAQRQWVAVREWSRAGVTFGVTFDEPGPVNVEAMLGHEGMGDALWADDTAGRVVHVAAHRPVTLVTRADWGDDTTAAYFVGRALSPDGESDAGVALSVVGPAALGAEGGGGSEMKGDGTALPVVVLVEAGRIGAAGLAALERHLEHGGGVVWVVDGPEATASLDGFEGSPIDVARWQGAAARSLGMGRFDDPILSAFEGAARSALLRTTFRETVDGALASEATALLTYADGGPAVAARWHGGGRLVVVGADLSPAATDLVKGPMLVPLLHQLIRHVAPGLPETPGPRVGEAVGMSAAAGQVVQRPGGDGEPGLHAVLDEATGELIDGMWVTVDPVESDLRMAEFETGTMAGRATGRHGDAVEAATARGGRVVPVELWGYAAMAAVLLAGLETAALWAMMSRAGPGLRIGWGGRAGEGAGHV